MLGRMGYPSVEAEDGATGIALARKTDFDLILLDLNLPDQRGTEVARAIRASEGPHRAQIVAVTADTMTDVQEQVLAAGMDDCVIKPVSMDKLAELIHLAGKRRAGAA